MAPSQIVRMVALALAFAWTPFLSQAQDRGTLVEKKAATLPAGPLFWRVENFATLAAAQAAAGPTGLPAEVGGKAWLFTLGPPGGESTGGSKVADIGPIAPVVATEYLLRVDHAVSAPGTKRGVHTHPGTEAWFVLAGEQTIRTSQGTITLGAGKSHSGLPGGTAMQSLNDGSTEMRSLVLFVLDAAKPFATPATFP